MKHTVTFVLALLAAAGAQASCYTVMGPKGQVLSQSPNPPVDMSYQLHQTVPYRYGTGASMVFGIADINCGNLVDPYYDLKPATRVVYRDGGSGKKHGHAVHKKVRRNGANQAAPSAEPSSPAASAAQGS